ncbi:MAG: thiol peroxidase [Desulfobacterales bacterium]|nr:thiol peroxidase [Desulfobacterales bacterium]MDX2509913.1 thiol peroxidase [Desulfobacterales bacterium]
MAQITFKGDPVHTIGELPKIGDKAPDFLLTKTDLSDISLKDVSGKKVILNIFPSIDTPVCSISVARFNEEISKFDNAIVIGASLDLPFAHARFCEAEGIKNVTTASELRNREFGSNYGVRMVDGPLAGLLARAIVVIDENSKVIYTQLVGEITQEPDYDKALNMLKNASDIAETPDTCVQSSTAEHARADDIDEPCDDGRAG